MNILSQFLNITAMKLQVSGAFFVANHKSLETGFWTCSSMCSTDRDPRAESAARQRVAMGHCGEMKIVRPRGH